MSRQPASTEMKFASVDSPTASSRSSAVSHSLSQPEEKKAKQKQPISRTKKALTAIASQIPQRFQKALARGTNHTAHPSRSQSLLQPQWRSSRTAQNKESVPATRVALLALLRDLRALHKADRCVRHAELRPLVRSLSSHKRALHETAQRLCVEYATQRRRLRGCEQGCRGTAMAANMNGNGIGKSERKNIVRAEQTCTRKGATQVRKEVCELCDDAWNGLARVRDEANMLGRRCVVVARAERLMREVEARAVGAEWVDSVRLIIQSCGKA